MMLAFSSDSFRPMPENLMLSNPLAFPNLKWIMVPGQAHETVEGGRRTHARTHTNSHAERQAPAGGGRRGRVPHGRERNLWYNTGHRSAAAGGAGPGGHKQWTHRVAASKFGGGVWGIGWARYGND